MKTYFQQRQEEFQEMLRVAKTEANGYSILRGITFIISVTLLIFYLRNQHITTLIFLLVTVIGFYVLVMRHRKAETAVRYYQALRDLNADEVKRLEHDLIGFETGGDFSEKDHPYQQDLDILGQSSLYQLINRCQIEDSKALLASWLSSPANRMDILSRQDAVQELAKKLEWSQKFTATIKLQLAEKEKRAPSVSHRDISVWTNKDTTIKNPRLWKWLAILLSIAFLSILTLVLSGLVTYHAIYLPIVINVVFLGFAIKGLNRMIKGVDKSHYLISSYEKAIELLEKSDFQSEKLVTLRSNLLSVTQSASRSISALASLTNRISSRSNMLYGLLDIPLLLDAHLLIDLHNWKMNHRRAIDLWFGTIHELECLISLGGFAHANPDYCFPEVSDKQFHFMAVALGHPLIPQDEKVVNDYSISGEGKVDIITGSNMSGKSTFQRTVGINMVLAQCGAPVDASRLSMGQTNIFSSMRTKDDLSEHTSSFYAELKRIHLLLESMKEQQSTFFLLDEILKGTNSEDRHQGAVALVKKLTKMKGFGMVSTHDLALAELEKTEKNVRNFSFNSSIEGDEILFDYKLTNGPCHSFNASKLMEKMGIM